MDDKIPQSDKDRRLRQLEEEVRRLSERLLRIEKDLDVEPNTVDPPPSIAPSAPITPPGPPPLPVKSALKTVKVPPPASGPFVPPSTGDQAMPSFPSRPSAAPEPVPEKDWREALRQWNLWPPEEEGSVEIQVGAWWATRVGALLAVIAVVFFGVHVAQHTAPWVRFLQLCGITAAIIAGGHWLEKRNAKFGSVIFSAGLAMAFFSAFAAYAVPAVQVIDGLLVAGVVQGVVVAGIVACSLWKNRASLATLAIGFGFVSCFFSFVSGLPDFSLFAAALLGAAGAALFLKKGWIPPFAISVPLAYVLTAVIVQWGWDEQTAWAFPFLMVPSVGFFVLFGASDYAGLCRNIILPLKQRRLILGVNVGGAVVVGFLATEAFAVDRLAWFYLTMAVLAGAGSLAYYRRNRSDEASDAYFAVAMALLALFFFEMLDARTRWLALGIQSLVMLSAVRRTGIRNAEVMMILVWVGSFALFATDTARLGYFVDSPGILSVWGLAAVAYLLLSAVLAGLQGRWFSELPLPLISGDDDHKACRSVLNCGYGVIVGAIAVMVASVGFADRWFPAASMLAAFLLLVTVIPLRNWIPVLSAAFPLVIGQVAFWTSSYSGEGAAVIWGNGLAAIALPLGCLFVFHNLVSRVEVSRESAIAAASGLVAFAVVSTQILAANLVTAEVYFVIAGILALLLLLTATRLRFDYLADMTFLPWLLGIAGPLMAWASGSNLLPSSGSGVLWWIGGALAVGTAVLYDCWPDIEERKAWINRIVPSIEGIVTTLAVLAVLYPIGYHMPEPSAVLAAAVFGTGFALLAWRPGWRRGSWAGGSVFLVGALVGVFVAIDTDGAVMVMSVLAMAAAAVGYVVLLTRLHPCGAGARKGWGWLISLAALGCLFVMAVARTEEYAAYSTVFWGIFSAIFLIVGITFRVIPLRLVGLIGLALCVPRAFLVDIHSTFYRIAAFAALGVALLIVGFLYHRFRSLILPVNENAGEE